MDATTGFKLLSAIEREFGCASICSSSVFYSFSNVANGPPPRNCANGIMSEIDKRFPRWSIIFFVFALPVLLGFIATFTVCCSKNRRKMDSGYGSKIYI
jgi:hypothetical protein